MKSMTREERKKAMTSPPPFEEGDIVMDASGEQYRILSAFAWMKTFDGESCPATVYRRDGETEMLVMANLEMDLCFFRAEEAQADE